MAIAVHLEKREKTTKIQTDTLVGIKITIVRISNQNSVINESDVFSLEHAHSKP